MFICLPYQSSAGWYDTLKPCILPLRPVGRGKSHDTRMLCDVRDRHFGFSGGMVGAIRLKKKKRKKLIFLII